jgi:hypothetical protein
MQGIKVFNMEISTYVYILIYVIGMWVVSLIINYSDKVSTDRTPVPKTVHFTATLLSWILVMYFIYMVIKIAFFTEESDNDSLHEDSVHKKSWPGPNSEPRAKHDEDLTRK